MLDNYNSFLEKKIHSPEFEDVIPKELLDISNLFRAAGKKLYIVGGCVRDYLQRKTPHDYDMVTDALPDESKKILKGWNVSDEQGKNFGVLRIYTKGEPLGHELATFRKDISNGRDVKGDDEKVEIGNHITIEDDIHRRDLTFNALFYDIQTKEIVDLVGGIDDLKNGIVRSVGDPAKRFAEDRLRILRIFRFGARSGGKIEKGTSEAIKNDNRLRGISSKDDVSQERIVQEVFKMMEYAITTNNPNTFKVYLELLDEYNMFEEMFPNVDINIPSKDFPTYNYLDEEEHYTIWLAIVLDKIETDKKSLNYLIRDIKIPGNFISMVKFFNDYKENWNNSEMAYHLSGQIDKHNIKSRILTAYNVYYNIGNEGLSRYIFSKIITDGNKIVEDGFVGKAVEDEKRRQETERYKTQFMTK